MEIDYSSIAKTGIYCTYRSRRKKKATAFIHFTHYRTGIKIIYESYQGKIIYEYYQELIKSRNSKNLSLTKSLIHQQYLSSNSLHFIIQIIAEITVL